MFEKLFLVICKKLSMKSCCVMRKKFDKKRQPGQNPSCDVVKHAVRMVRMS